MRRLVLSVILAAVAATAHAQVSRAPRVQVTHERGPISAQVLARAWPGRAFARCQAETTEDVVHLHVRVDPDASVVVEHGLLGASSPSERCVVEVVTAARFLPQTEATHAHVTVFLRPTLTAPRQRSKPSSVLPSTT